jgi:hypothetical protein
MGRVGCNDWLDNSRTTRLPGAQEPATIAHRALLASIASLIATAITWLRMLRLPQHAVESSTPAANGTETN